MKPFGCLLLALFFFLLLPLSATAQQTSTMRCQNGIVSINDTIAEVLSKCGPPAFQDRRAETHSGGTSHGHHDAVTVDDWTYNFGPQAFMYQVIFENGRVNRIESRDQGY